MTPTLDELLAAARRTRESAYAPYSRFNVGAAVRAADGRTYTGCNVENASFGLTVCAERVAIFAAIAAGAREIVELAVVTDVPEPAAPCGACRQVLAEFSAGAEIALGNLDGKVVVTRLGDLLPMAFRLREPR